MRILPTSWPSIQETTSSAATYCCPKGEEQGGGETNLSNHSTGKGEVLLASSQLLHGSEKRTECERAVQQRMEDGTTKELSTQSEVEKAIWEEIHGKRFYIAGRAPICKGKLHGEFGYMSNTPAAREALAGTYQWPEGTHRGTMELVEEIAHIDLLFLKEQ